MAVTTTPIFPQTIQSTCTQLTNATGTTVTQIYAAGTNGTRIENIAVTNTDTNSYTLNLYVQQSSTNYLLATFNIPASAGNSTSVPTLNLLANSNAAFNYGPDGNNYIYLNASDKLMAGVTSTITSGKTMQFIVQAGDY